MRGKEVEDLRASAESVQKALRHFESEKRHVLQNLPDVPLVRSQLQFQDVHAYLKARLGSGCRYTLMPKQPEKVLVNGGRILLFLVDVGYIKEIPVTCSQPMRTIFLRSCTCQPEVDIGLQVCGEKRAPIHTRFVFKMCVESGVMHLDNRVNGTMDASLGLCSIMPTGPLRFLTEFATRAYIKPLEKKKRNAAVSAFASSRSTLRAEAMDVMEKLGIRYASYGRYRRNANEREFSASVVKYERKIETISNHKFHLAFEHSISNSYVTEKVFHALASNSVPLYAGGPEARFLLPPHSTIFLRDFDYNLTRLFEYVKYLDGNDTAYDEWLKWRDVATKPGHPYAEFCRQNALGHHRDRFCFYDYAGHRIIDQLERGEMPPPYLTRFTDWTNGKTCLLDEHSCARGRDFKEAPTVTCGGVPYSMGDIPRRYADR